MGKLSKKKIILITISSILVVLLGIGSVFGINYINKTNKERQLKNKIEADRVEIKSELTIDTGSEVPTIDSFIKKQGNFAKDKAIITYVNIDEEVDDKDLQTVIIYLDKDNKEVIYSEALEQKENCEKTEENNCEVLKEGYKEKTIVTGIGTYNVTIKDDKNDKEYKLVLKIVDDEKPVLKTKNAEITEGEDISINSFIESCSDNSHSACFYSFVKENDKKIERTDEFDKSVGEHELKLIAYDLANNETEVKTVKLKVNEKKKEVSTPAPTKKPSTSTSKPSSSGNSNNQSNNQPSKPTQNTPICASYGKLPIGLAVDFGENGADMDRYYELRSQYTSTPTSRIGKASMDMMYEVTADTGLYVQTVANDFPATCSGNRNYMRGIYAEIVAYDKSEGKGCIGTDNCPILAKAWVDTNGNLHYTQKNY